MQLITLLRDGLTEIQTSSTPSLSITGHPAKRKQQTNPSLHHLDISKTKG